MSKENIKTIDCYSHRARLVKDYYHEFIVIFGIGVNPDIQYISDTYLGYEVAVKYQLACSKPFQQLLWDSMKMYRHGSLIPNSSGGYQEIENRTWMELVQVGRFRSISLAENILNQFENYELNFNNTEIDYICKFAIENALN